MEKNKKAMLIIIFILIVLNILLVGIIKGYVKLSRIIGINFIEKTYEEQYELYGKMKSARYLLEYSEADKNGVYTKKKSLGYYYINDGKKLFKETVYELKNDYIFEPIYEVYINLDNKVSDNIYKDVVKVNLKDYTQEIVAQYEHEDIMNTVEDELAKVSSFTNRNDEATNQKIKREIIKNYQDLILYYPFSKVENIAAFIIMNQEEEKEGISFIINYPIAASFAKLNSYENDDSKIEHDDLRIWLYPNDPVTEEDVTLPNYEE